MFRLNRDRRVCGDLRGAESVVSSGLCRYRRTPIALPGRRPGFGAARNDHPTHSQNPEPPLRVSFWPERGRRTLTGVLI